MASKEQDVATSSISPVLFLTLEGRPMSFYLRPGSVKVKLQPLITAGGGNLCNVQKPGAILLMDPTEEGSISESTVHWYVSTNYITDCIEQNKQLNLEDYKLDPSAVRKYSTRVGNSNKPSYTALLGGRQHYTPEEDAAIISYVSKYQKRLGGNLIWKEMEKQGLTCHSWQSMKYRYHSRLAKKDVDEPTAEKEPKVQEAKDQVDKDQERESEKSSAAEDASESESRQNSILPAENIQPEVVEEERAAENDPENTDEADPAKSPQPESPVLYPAADSHPLPAESTDTDETQAVVPTPDKIPPTDSPQPEPTSLPEVSALEASQVKHKSPLRPRSARRHLLLKGLPSPDGGGGQSASSVEPLPASPKPSRKTKSSVQSPQRDATAAEEPPSKKARADDVTAVAQVHQAADAGTTHPDSTGTEAASSPQKGGKRREKRKLGILEMATREFESESDGDSDPTEDSQLETEAENSTKAVPGCSTSDPGASSELGCQRGADLQENLQENGQSNEAAEEKVQETRTPLGSGGSEAAAGTAAPAASKAHLFIFDRESQDVESQDVESQSILAERTAMPARPREAASADSARSLSQMQLEEDRQRLRKLMEETKQDLVTVTKALLRTSGDFSEAQDLLLDLLPASGTLWQCSDDERLTSGDPAVRLQLQEKYGEELVAKRVVFLELKR